MIAPRLLVCLLAAPALLAAGCQTPASRGAADLAAEAPAGWRAAASAEDVDRLGRIGAAWSEALADARRAGFSRQVQAEGALLDPQAALPRPQPSPGSYLCRVVRIGTEGRGRAFQAFRPFFCHVGVEGDLLSITKQTGTQRPGGYLWDDEANLMVFLGSMALGDEETPLPYGADRSRDMIGAFERVAPLRFRLVVPWPRGSSKLDVFELVPAPVQRDE